MSESSWDEQQELLAHLGKRFEPGEVKQRKQGGRMLDYVSIDATINRLNKVLGTSWNWELDRADVKVIHVRETPGKRDGEITVEYTYLAQVAGHLYALGASHGGVGSDVANDADKALKTALAEALKKAGHQYGIGLYLWDEAEREYLSIQRDAQGGDIDALKMLVFERAQREGCEQLTREGIAEHFGLTEDELDDPELLVQLAGI